jgi:hypothetical protein
VETLTDDHLARFLLGYPNKFGSGTRTGTEILGAPLPGTRTEPKNRYPSQHYMIPANVPLPSRHPISELSHRKSGLIEDPHETRFLFQCISVALQRTFLPAFVEYVALRCLVSATVFGNVCMQATRDVKLPTYNFFIIHARMEFTWNDVELAPGAHLPGAHLMRAHRLGRTCRWRTCMGRLCT